jgi:hypothetical protein
MMKRVLICLTMVLSASAASASIALFSDGRAMKIDSYEVQEETIHLTIAGGGGKLSLPMTRIERIIEDEVITAEVVAEVEKIVETGVFPRRSWKFDENSRPLFNSKFDETIIEAARRFDVDAALVSAVIKAESDYDTRIVSSKGARGLMQLMPATAKRFGVRNSFDPVQNIYGGTRYLRWLLKEFDGNADLAVAAYNAGEGNVWKYNGVPPYRETVNYIGRIAKHIRKAIEKQVIPSASAEMPAIVTAALPD